VPSDVERMSRERVADHRAVGKLFQMTGPATAKLLVLLLILPVTSRPHVSFATYYWSVPTSVTLVENILVSSLRELFDSIDSHTIIMVKTSQFTTSVRSTTES